jgi:hypothetical protein
LLSAAFKADPKIFRKVNRYGGKSSWSGRRSPKASGCAVPIHNHLLEQGFLEYVEDRRRDPTPINTCPLLDPGSP